MCQKKKLQAIIFLGLFMLIILSGCSNKKNVEEEQAKFDQFLETEYKDTVSTDTMTLHFQLEDPVKFGIEEFDPTLGEFSMERIKADQESMTDTLKKMKNFSYESLSQKQQKMYDLYYDYIELQLEYKGFEYYMNPLSYNSGITTNLPTNFMEYKFVNQKDVTDYLVLLGEVDDYFDQVITFVKEQSRLGFYMPDFAVDMSLEQCKKFVDDSDENMLIGSFDSKIELLDDLTEEQKTQYKSENKQKIEEVLIPAYKKIMKVMEDLKGTGTNEAGLSNFKDGKKFYELIVKEKTGSNKTVKELQSSLEEHVKDLVTEMYKIFATDAYVVDRMERVTFDYKNPDEILEVLKERLKENYPEVPDVNYKAEYLHKSVETESTMAYYLIPQLDNLENNVIKVNKTAVANSPKMLFTTLAHEGYPGHLYETVYHRNTDPYPLENTLSFLGYQEGWSTYVEADAFNMNKIDDENVIRMLQIDSLVNTALPVIIDIGINYEGWDKKEVLEYLTTLGLGDEETANNLFELCVAEPGIMLPYAVGYFEIIELKEKAMDKLKDQFVEKDFNKAILDAGPSPFEIVSQYVDQYIKEASK